MGLVRIKLYSEFVYQFYTLLKVQPEVLLWNFDALLPSHLKIRFMDYENIRFAMLHLFSATCTRQNMHY